ncbi:MAG: DUF2294 domain-containing protein [Nitriliruptoraceae bacterium]
MERRTKGQIEAAITAAMTQFEREYLGRGPREARTFLIEDLVLVRLKGILSPAELQLSREPGGVAMIKTMRSRLVESCAPALTDLIAAETGTTVVSMHADISATTGERVFVFALEAPPEVAATSG